jgi:hypothetical protein
VPANRCPCLARHPLTVYFPTPVQTYMAASGMLRQLYFGQLDMELHHRYDPSTSTSASTSETPFDVQRRVAERYLVVPPLPEDRCVFRSSIFGCVAFMYVPCRRQAPALRQASCDV